MTTPPLQEQQALTVGALILLAALAGCSAKTEAGSIDRGERQRVFLGGPCRGVDAVRINTGLAIEYRDTRGRLLTGVENCLITELEQ